MTVFVKPDLLIVSTFHGVTCHVTMVSFKLCVTETTITMRHVIYHNRYKACGSTSFLFKKKGSMYIIVFLKYKPTNLKALLIKYR